jgi:hypothetical protein
MSGFFRSRLFDRTEFRAEDNVFYLVFNTLVIIRVKYLKQKRKVNGKANSKS